MKTFSTGFVTNSSTVVFTVAVKPSIVDKLEEVDLHSIVKDKYPDFADRYFYDEFADKVKSKIPEAFQHVLSILKTNKEEPYIVLKTECDVDGDGLDFYRPDIYALYFVLKEIVSKYADTVDEAYL